MGKLQSIDARRGADFTWFFYMLHGKPHSWCKACYIADRVDKGDRSGYGNKHAHADHARAC